jgi:protein phosphatase inhibitor 2
MDFESTPDDNTPNLMVDTTVGPATTSSGPSTGTNTPTGRKTPVKPALKTSSSMEEEEEDKEHNSNNININNNASSSPRMKKKKSKKKNRKLQWDEARIQEHDKLRGTRMKIDEPNTPFATYDSGSETDASVSSAKGNKQYQTISWDALTNKLEAHAAVAKDNNVYPPSSPSSHGGGHTTDEEEANEKRERQRKELKRLEFQEHRKRHYNEMEVVRRFQRENPDGVPSLNGHDTHEDDTDEDNDGDDER